MNWSNFKVIQFKLNNDGLGDGYSDFLWYDSCKTIYETKYFKAILCTIKRFTPLANLRSIFSLLTSSTNCWLLN